MVYMSCASVDHFTLKPCWLSVSKHSLLRKMLNNMALFNMLKYLWGNAVKWHRPIVWWIWFLTFLVNSTYFGVFPLARHTSGINSVLICQEEDALCPASKWSLVLAEPLIVWSVIIGCCKFGSSTKNSIRHHPLNSCMTQDSSILWSYLQSTIACNTNHLPPQ